MIIKLVTLFLIYILKDVLLSFTSVQLTKAIYKAKSTRSQSGRVLPKHTDGGRELMCGHLCKIPQIILEKN